MHSPSTQGKQPSFIVVVVVDFGKGKGQGQEGQDRIKISSSRHANHGFGNEKGSAAVS
jgi:hypothetical protein